MDAKEKQLMIRMNYDLGRKEGQVALASLNESDWPLLEFEGATRMKVTDGFQYSQTHGFWHTVGHSPLSLVRLEIEEGAANV